MGITKKNGIPFFLYLKKQGVSFENFAMLGRQELNTDEKTFARTLKDFGYDKQAVSKLIVDCQIQNNKGLSEPFFHFLGSSTIDSFDASSYENATVIHDMNTPIADSHKQKYDIVFDGGTLEHIFNFPVAVKNAMEMLKVGGYFIGQMPANNYLGHGFYQFSPELLFRVFSEENGFEVKEMLLTSDRIKGNWKEMPDPNQVKSRVIMRSAYDALIFVVAKRVAVKPIFEKTPQQSDYSEVLWKSQNTIDKLTLTNRIRSFVLRKLYRLTPFVGITNTAFFKDFKEKNY